MLNTKEPILIRNTILYCFDNVKHDVGVDDCYSALKNFKSLHHENQIFKDKIHNFPGIRRSVIF